MTKIETIEEEFDEPFDETVKSFARMGYSRRAVASILEINLSYFRQLCTRKGLHRYFKKQKDMRRECRRQGYTRGGWPKGKLRPYKPRKYTDEELLAEVSRWPSFGEFKSWASMPPSTVSRRFKLPWQEIVHRACSRNVCQLEA